MQAYLIESLSSSGWRRAGALYWRKSDATKEADRRVAKRTAKACRVLSVTVQPDEVYAVGCESAEAIA